MRTWFLRNFLPSTPYSWMILAGLLVLGCIVVLKERRDKKEIEGDPGKACGMIIEYERSGHSGRLIRYEYYVDGIRYTAIAGGDKRFGDCVQTHSCIGLTFEVEYARNNPANSQMIWAKPNCTISR